MVIVFMVKYVFVAPKINIFSRKIYRSILKKFLYHGEMLVGNHSAESDA